MEIRRKEINMKNAEGTAYFIGDLHVGIRSCAKDMVSKAVGIIEDDPECIFWIGMGDYMDSITKDDKRYEVESSDPDLPTPADQQEWFMKTFKPIQDKCLGLHIGNHEATLIKETGNFMQKIICPTMKVDFLGYIALQTLVFPKGEHTMLTTHGAGSANPKTFEKPEVCKAHIITKIRRILIPLAKADSYFMGHIHKLAGELPNGRPTLVNITNKLSAEIKIDGEGTGMFENGDVVKRKILDWPPVVSTGSFLKTYTPGKTKYAERSLYAPLDIGMIRVRFNKYGDILEIEEIDIEEVQ